MPIGVWMILIWEIEGFDKFWRHKPHFVTKVTVWVEFVWHNMVNILICPNVFPDPIELVKVAHQLQCFFVRATFLEQKRFASTKANNLCLDLLGSGPNLCACVPASIIAFIMGSIL